MGFCYEIGEGFDQDWTLAEYWYKKAVEQDHEEAGERLAKMIKFDILLKFDDKSIQMILRSVDSNLLARAMKGEDAAVQEKIFSNMSKGAALILKDEISYSGQAGEKEVKDAQKKILDIVNHLLNEGLISF
jgi:flagellar motor switch protein FliG